MKSKKAHVEVFNNSMEPEDDRCDHTWHHRPDTGAPIFGVMFLLSGVMLFLNVIGQVPWGVWNVIWKFWPVILIFIGIQILSGVILFLLAFFVFGIIAIYSLQVVSAPFISHWVLPEWIIFWVDQLRRIMV